MATFLLVATFAALCGAVVAPQSAQPERSTAEAMIDVREVADMFRCSPRTVYNRVADGSFPLPVKIGRLTRWDRAELVVWMKQGCPRVAA